jgi:hypothetical protein
MTSTKKEKNVRAKEKESLMITTLKVRVKSDGFEFRCQISPADLDSSVKFNLTIFFYGQIFDRSDLNSTRCLDTLLLFCIFG